MNYTGDREILISWANKRFRRGITMIVFTLLVGIVLFYFTINSIQWVPLFWIFVPFSIYILYRGTIRVVRLLSRTILELEFHDDKLKIITYNWSPYLLSRGYVVQIKDITKMRFKQEKNKFKKSLRFIVVERKKKRQFIVFDNTGLDISLIHQEILSLKAKK